MNDNATQPPGEERSLRLSSMIRPLVIVPLAIIVVIAAGVGWSLRPSRPVVDGVLTDKADVSYYTSDEIRSLTSSPDGHVAVLRYVSPFRLDSWFPGSEPSALLGEGQGVPSGLVAAVTDDDVVYVESGDGPWSVDLIDGQATKLPAGSPTLRTHPIQVDRETMLVHQDDTLALWRPGRSLPLEPVTASGAVLAAGLVLDDNVAVNDTYFLTHRYSESDGEDRTSMLQAWRAADRGASNAYREVTIPTLHPLSMALTSDNRALLVTSGELFDYETSVLNVWNIDESTVTQVPLEGQPTLVEVLPNGVIAVAGELAPDDPTIEDPLNRGYVQFLDPDTFEVVAQRRGRDYPTISPAGSSHVITQSVQRVDMENTEDPDDFRRVYGVELWDVDEFSGQ